MNARCVNHFVRGMGGCRPVPHHADYTCWVAGRDFATTAIAVVVLLVIAAILVGIGFVLGRTWA